MQLATFTVKGMYCEGCAERIRTLLQRQQGVREAEVPFAGGGDTWVRFNPHMITRERLVAVVEEAGFHVAEST